MANSDTKEAIFVGKEDATAYLTLALANRHGLVTGATGTGKTVTLQGNLDPCALYASEVTTRFLCVCW